MVKNRSVLTGSDDDDDETDKRHISCMANQQIDSGNLCLWSEFLNKYQCRNELKLLNPTFYFAL